MFKFKKVASLMAGAVMMGSTVALAAAANFPAPFVSGGQNDVAIVYGTNAAITDLVAATNIADNLNGYVVGGSATTGTDTAVSGEAYPLFTSSSQLFMNSTLNSVRTILAEQELPTILADGTLDGDVTATYEQRILIGPHPSITFAQMPTSNDDPKIGLSIGTSPTTQYLYNATVTFDQNVAFNHTDTIGEDITLFGQKFTVGGATTNTKLVLLKSSETVFLTSDDPSATVMVEGNEYTIDLVSASTSDATLKVTDSNGNTEQKQINEAASKKILGIEVGVDTADSNNLRYIASVSVGANRITLQDGSAIKVGADEDTIDGTNVEFETAAGAATTTTGAIGKIIFQSAAPDSDSDAIFPGQAFVDPIFGSFKVDFSGVTIPADSANREMIEVKNSGNDKMTVKFQSHDGTEAKSVNWVYNRTDSKIGTMDLADSDGDPIVVAEMAPVNKSQYVVLASDDEGGLYEVTRIYNSSSTTASDDEITLKNVFNGESSTFKATSEGSGTATVQGKSFTFTYSGASTLAGEAMTVRFNFPESASNEVILFPTIKTKGGAKVAFYEPKANALGSTALASGNVTLQLSNWDNLNNNVTGISFQDGDGYSSVTVGRNTTTDLGVWNFTFPGGSVQQVNTSLIARSASGTIGKLTYNITASGTAGGVNVYLVNPDGGANLARPALIVFEEKDDSSNYEALIATLDAGYDGDSAGIGVSDVVRTWGSDAALGNAIQLETNSDLYQDIDWWGTITTEDRSDSDQTVATLSYPMDQIEAEIYIAEEAAAITPGSGGNGGSGTTVGVPILDSEASSASNKNWIVVGGSCINSVAADLLGVNYPTCGADWTATTNVGAGEYLIESFAQGNKVATLVAGFNAGDTTNAATYLRTQTGVDTTVGKKYKGTSSTTATLVTDTTA